MKRIIVMLLMLFLISGCSRTVIQDETPVETPVEPVVQEVFDVKINSFTCEWRVKTGDYGVKSDCVTIIANGTAEGPLGARLELPIASWSNDKFDCGAWTLRGGAFLTVGSTCIHEEGQPENTGWEVVAEGCPLKDYYDNKRAYSAKLYKDDEMQPVKQDRKEVVCG